MIEIQCVFGNSDLEHVRRCILPNLAAATSREIRFLGLNYEGGEGLEDADLGRVHVRAINGEPGAGFGANHNLIARQAGEGSMFVLMNPDCIPMPGCIDSLIERKKSNVAIVEGRQWPFEHPKVYNPLTLETPWASFAFCLMDRGFYEAARGMDELYFLYDEDVDLSWRAWLMGWRVLYEPCSQIIHYTDGYFPAETGTSLEQYYSLRNFPLVAAKFFGEDAEAKALDTLRTQAPPAMLQDILDDYHHNVAPNIDRSWAGKGHEMIRIYGLNSFAATRA